MLNVNTLLMPIFIKLPGLHQTIVQTPLIWFHYTETCYSLFCDQTRCMSGQTSSLAWCMTGFTWGGNFSSYNVFQLVTLKNISELSKQEIWLALKRCINLLWTEWKKQYFSATEWGKKITGCPMKYLAPLEQWLSFKKTHLKDSKLKVKELICWYSCLTLWNACTQLIVDLWSNGKTKKTSH